MEIRVKTSLYLMSETENEFSASKGACVWLMPEQPLNHSNE